jgi:DNA repair photolyase
MHSEMEWLTKTDGGESVADAYRFFMRPDPDMRDFLGPIEKVEDPFTGKEMRTRRAKVAMIRNAPEDSMKEMTIYLDPLPHIRLEKAKPLQGWYQSLTNDSPKSRPRPCYTDAMLTEPYGGMCPVGCSFCYINAGFRGYRGTGLMTVPLNYGEQVRQQLKKNRTGAAGYFSSFSDPFLALETYYHNTQHAAEAFDEVGLPVFFLSRLQYPGWALDLLQKNKYSYAQKSINTPDPDDWAKLSPGALPLMDHLDEIREMRRRGIYVSIQVNPIVPGIVSHDDVERLFEMLADAGANHVIVKFVEAGFSWAPAMVDRIVQRFGDNRATEFRDLFVQNIGGQRTVAEEYRLEGHRRYQAKAIKLGLSYAVCYEYRAVPGTAGVSLGREFMTSDQCHGQRVPMFTRLDTSVPFSEVEACPPSGCLTCSADNEGEPKCGNDLLGSAKAMRSPDYKTPVLTA